MRNPIRALLRWRPARWIAATLLLAVTAVALHFLAGPAPSEASRAQDPVGQDISYGPATAKVALVEYSDFECGYCAAYAPMMTELRAEYGDRVLFVFRNFPLSNHDHALISAQAAYAAYLQGKFWEMHDLLYANQDTWVDSPDPVAFFEACAQSLGLDVQRFQLDMQAAETIEFIKAQKLEGEQAGVTHTPWFVIDGEVVVPRDLEDFKAYIEAAL